MKRNDTSDFLARRDIFNGIYTVDQFHLILDRERALCDRKGDFFSLIVFTFGRHHRLNQPIHRFADNLKKRIRSSDILGWLDGHCLGMLLSDTTNAGAVELVKGIKAAMPPERYDYAVDIYTYPENSIPCRIQKTAEGPECSDEKQFQFSRYMVKDIPVWKRMVDIIGAVFALIVLSPVMLLIAVFIKLVSRGPVFFRQERLGYLGRLFICYKFRTMYPNADPEKHKAHLADLIHSGQVLRKIDDRPDAGVIPFGNVLRKLGLDELPQLFNVLKGDMSLIGPRPCMVYEAAEFAPWQHRRFDIHPGLTGLWQVSGKNRTTFTEMMRLDINYSKKRSLLRDIVIVLKTFPAVIQQLVEPKSTDKKDR